MNRTPSAHGKRFYCREWAFAKINHCLETRQSSKTCGALIMGGPGSGKSVLCSEIAWPTSNHGRQKVLKRRLLAYHFCQAHDVDTLSVVKFIRCLVAQISTSELVPGYAAKLNDPEVQVTLEDNECQLRPDEAFKRAVLFPLLELDPPKQACFMLVDSIDETYLQTNEDRLSSGTSVTMTITNTNTTTTTTTTSSCESNVIVSRTIAELLANHHQLFPQWLLLFCSSRKQSKSVNKLFTGFRKISLDDLHKTHVVRDVQQYILSRLDQEESLRQHLSRETAEMLNQLHIKSNGCFLYLETVLNGVIDNFIVLREIREIPGTLNGLYLWLCQRLFNRKQFAKVHPILNVLLAARRPITLDDLYTCVKIKTSSTSSSSSMMAFTREDFNKRLLMLSKLILDGGRDSTMATTKILFHHSFAEWLVDVKHCTQKYLCSPSEGHWLLAMCYTLKAPKLKPNETKDFAWHLSRVLLDKPWDTNLLPLWMIYSGAPVEDVMLTPITPEKNQKATWLLLESGASHIKNDQRRTTSYDDVQVEQLLPPSMATSQEEESLLIDEEDDDNDVENTTTTVSNQDEPTIPVDPVDQLLTNGISVTSIDATNGRTLLHNAVYDNDTQLASLFISRALIDMEIVDKNGQTALNLAARQGNTASVRLLLTAGADADHADNEGWTPLRASAWGGHTDVVSALLEHNAQIDLADSDQRTALRAAAWGGHDEIVAKLLEFQACVNLVDAEGRTALMAASYMGHPEIVDHLLKSGADVNHQDRDGRTALSVAALCVAASQGHSKVVDILLENGAEVNHHDNDGMTPLLVSCVEGDRQVCEMLLEYDADADHVDANGRSPLLAAASMGHSDIVNLLLFFGAAIDTIDAEGRTVLSVAASQGNVEVVRQLLDRGLDEMHKCNSGWTPLHYASFEGHQDVCVALLEAGARVNEVDNDGKHAIILAAQEGHLNAVIALADGGATIDHRSHDGRSALRVAALEGHKDVVVFLLERGANANYIDADGRSTLYLLALENHLTIAAFLIEYGVHIESVDVEGRTPLHVASWQNHLQMVELLLDGDASVDAIDLDRRTALQLASWQGHVEVVKKLLQRGASVDHTCNQGATALCIAAQEGHEQVVRILIECGADPGHADQFGRSPARVASKCGHTNVVRLLEEYGGTVGCCGGDNSSGNSSQFAKSPGFTCSNSATSMASCSTAETKPCSVILCPPGFNSPAISPRSTFEKRKSISEAPSSSKSSGNLTTSTKSSRGGGGCGAGTLEQPIPTSVQSSHQHHQMGLSFTQQLQQCTRLRNRPQSIRLTNLGELQTPIITPMQSPTGGGDIDIDINIDGDADDNYDHQSFRLSSMTRFNSSPKTLAFINVLPTSGRPRPLPLPPPPPPPPPSASTSSDLPSIHSSYHPSFSPWIDQAIDIDPVNSSPEVKLRRNGIVTNPNYVKSNIASGSHGKTVNIQIAQKQQLRTIGACAVDQPVTSRLIKKETPL